MDDRNKYNPENVAHRAIAAKIVEKRDRLDSRQKAEVADAMNAGNLAKAQEILKKAR
uniref:hypothetical protein n=1 Tax=Promicromonospora sp. CA-289581 TaxID=3240013 RepID=UPI003F498322